MNANYDFICSIGELIDKLSIENIKCFWANNQILDLRQQKKLDHVTISRLELQARTAGEQRCRLKDEINRRLAEALERGSIGTAPEVRTYKLDGHQGG
jgi:hypothetical protein